MNLMITEHIHTHPFSTFACPFNVHEFTYSIYANTDCNSVCLQYSCKNMNLMITKLPDRYGCMCMLTCFYARLNSKDIKKNFGGLPPMSTLIITVTMYDQSVPMLK